MFCKKCSNLLFPKEGKMRCSCGYTQEEGKITDKKKKKESIIAVEEKKIEILPKMKYDCIKCKNTDAYFWTLQTRSADEPETRFFKCTKCENVVREY